MTAERYRVVRVADPEGREFAVVDGAEGGAEVGRLSSRDAAALAAREANRAEARRNRPAPLDREPIT